jgi:hypothetical protein
MPFRPQDRLGDTSVWVAAVIFLGVVMGIVWFLDHVRSVMQIPTMPE